MKRFALTAIGPDRPGIIAAVTKALFEHDCNIEDSSMTSIEDEFSIILIGAMPQGADPKGLAADLRKIESALGLSIQFKELGPRLEEGPPGNYLITLHGADKAGIVYKTTGLLASMDVNITDLETKVIGSPPVYIMLIEAYIQDGANISLLEEELSALERTLGVTISIKQVEDAEVL